MDMARYCSDLRIHTIQNKYVIIKLLSTLYAWPSAKIF